MNLCKCGCGAEVKKVYAKGHYSRVFNPTRDNPEIAKRAIANAHKVRHAALKNGTQKIWNEGLTKDNDERVAHNNDHSRGKKMEEYITDPERLKIIKKKFSNMAKNRTPEHKQKIKEGLVEYWSDEENRLKQSKRRTDWMLKTSFQLSKFESDVIEFLTEKEIDFKHQFRISTKTHNKVYDFKIRNSNILVECDGNFHHCDPKQFPNGPKYKCQITHIENDKIKNELAKEQGYTLVRIWHDEFYTDKEELLKRIKAAQKAA